MITEEQNSYKSSLTDLIDDAVYGRFDKRKLLGFGGKEQTSEEGEQKLYDTAPKKIVEGIKKNKPGRGLKDVALFYASFLDLIPGDSSSCPGANVPNTGLRSWTKAGPFVHTPQELGVPKYEGTPKEAAKIVKHAARSFGACRVGITGLDKRHVYQYDCDGKELVFEPVEEPYETEEKRVIPEKCKYVVVMLIQMAPQDLAQAPFPVGAHAPIWTYMMIELLTAAVANFIRGLGYTALPSANDTTPSIPLALEAGLGELGRMDRLISPDFGPMVRICKVFTDLPMELDSPRSFGITRFCKVCRRCAEVCPARAINTDPEPSFKAPSPWVSPGHKSWSGPEDVVKCHDHSQRSGRFTCAKCIPICPWNKPKGLLHTLVRAIIKKTSIFNRLFIAADKLFGYGKPAKPEKWWELKLPTYGIDTRI